MANKSLVLGMQNKTINADDLHGVGSIAHLDHGPLLSDLPIYRWSTGTPAQLWPRIAVVAAVRLKVVD